MSAQGTFWARRRAAVQAEAEAEARAEIAAEQEAAFAEKDDAEVLEELGLPAPESLQAGDDFAAFMARDVPKHLQNRALRSLWRSNPVLACVDGLNEYDDDYRAAMLAMEPIKTAYQVGKGMMSHLEEVARQEEAAKQVAEVEAEGPCEPEEEIETPEAVSAAEEVTSEPAPLPSVETEVSDPAPRRMRFRFEEAAV
ncbi:DUF3306 domain-containing protein [Roseobacter sp. EG26]|uniref:DUF3306 domain-containing protein n=1 Tax=Roseobacter sp. EG26 TaxID=3412477 RepID=UPI003CE5AD04